MEFHFSGISSIIFRFKYFVYTFLEKSLRRKILFGFIIILLIMLLISFWGIFNIYKISQNYKSTLYQNYSSVIAVDNIGKSIDNMMEAILQMNNKNFNEGRTYLETSKADFYLWFQKARETAFTEKEQILLDSLGVEYSSFLNLLHSYEENFDRNYARSTDAYFTSLIESSIEMKNRCYGIFLTNHDLIYNRVKKIDRISDTATVLLVFTVLGGIFLSFVFSSKFSNYLTKPLQDLAKSAKHIADGNFSGRITLRSTDEIGNLAAEFNKMSQRLQKYEMINISKLLYEKKKSEVVIESINEPVILLDGKLTLLMANKSFKELFGNEDTKKILSDFETLLNSKDTENFTRTDQILQASSKAGWKYFKLIYSEINLPESGELGYVIVFSDITKFQEIDNMKSEFLGKVSHELKTPLTSVGMALGIMEEEIVGKLTPGQQSLIQSMKEDYNRLNSLVHEILELTKLESGNFILQLNVIDVNEVLEHLIRNFSLYCKDKNITLTLCSDNSHAFINADYEYLFRALENIISNAFKFTPSEGEIKISLRKSGGQIIINIIDTGIGIPEDKISDIFNKFVQINDDIPGSVGLGLSIAKEIIDMHKGEISVTSTPGKGSNFQITLMASENV